MSSDFHVGLPWSTDNSPMDVLSYDIALQQLLDAHVVSEDGLMDYALSQALRGLCFAVKSASRPLSQVLGPTPQPTPNAPHAAVVWVGGCEAVLDAMCRSAVAEPQYLPTVAYLSKRLLCDTASDFGEGNERPSCTVEWTQGLLLQTAVADSNEEKDTLSPDRAGQRRKESYFSSRFSTDRRVQLGYLWMLTGTLRLIATDPIQHSHLFTNHLTLVRGIVEGVFSRISTLADAKECENSITLVDPLSDGGAIITEDISDPLTLPDVSAALPSRLTVEANHFIIHCVHWLCTDVLTVYQSMQSGNQKTRKVLDRDAPLMIWKTVTLTRNALRRGLAWIQSEMQSIWLKEAATASSTKDVKPTRKVLSSNVYSVGSDPAACALLNQVSHHLESTITNMIKTQEKLNYARTGATRRYGKASKDYTQLTEMMWVNTIQVCFMLQSLTRSWMVTHGGMGITAVDSSFVLGSNKDILGYIGSCISLIPSLEGRSDDKVALTQASHVLLSALIALVASAPLMSMQANLWMSDPDCTRQIHEILVQRALRGKDEKLQQMAALLAGSILRSTSPTTDLSLQLTSEVSNQLLDVLSETRDAASHYAIEMLTIAVVRKPHSLIPSLFKLLKSGGPQTRRNVLDVLSALPNLSSSRALHGLKNMEIGREEKKEEEGKHALVDLRTSAILFLPGEENMREVLRLLAENLLSHLNDNDLLIRMESASLFGKVWPEDVLQPLLTLFLNSDSTGRRQSAIKSSLKAVLLSHTDDASVLLMLMQEAFCVFREKVLAQLTSLNVDASSSSTNSFPFLSYERKKKVPTTPGDILNHSLLYTFGTLQNVEDTETAPSTNTDEFVIPPVPSSRKKEGSIQALIKSLCKDWAASVKEWRSETHLEPLLVFLKQLDHSPKGPQKWFLDQILPFFEYLTTSWKSSPREGKNFVFPNHVMIQALYNIFFRAGAEEKGGQKLSTNTNADEKIDHSSSLDEEPSWVHQMRKFMEVFLEFTDTPFPVLDEYHKVLLPLIILGNCSCRFITPSDSLASSSVASRHDYDVQGESIQAITHKIWCALWDALTDDVGIYLRIIHHDVTILFLRAICSYPAIELFRELQIRTRNGEIFLNHFFYRILLFGISYYTNEFIALLASHPISLEEGNPPSNENNAPGWTRDRKDDVIDREKVVYDDMKSCVDTTDILPLITQNFVLNQIKQNHGGSMGYYLNFYLSRINDHMGSSATEVYGLLTLAYFLDNTLLEKAWSVCAIYSYNPLKELEDCNRNECQTKSRKKGKISSSPSNDATSQEVLIQLKKKFELCINTISKGLDYLIASERTNGKLLLSWFKCYLRPLIELSNAVCASNKRKEKSDYIEAINCTSLIFKALIMTDSYYKKKLSPLSRIAAITSGSSNPSSTLVGCDFVPQDYPFFKGNLTLFLSLLPCEDLEALPNFALGCVKFRKSPDLQKVGLRILFILITQAYDSLTNVRTEGNQSILTMTMSELCEFKYTHPDKETRTLAERLVDGIGYQRGL
ncbi:unnamed protein product [Phytomonas sp. Hart1]|nr:unnamed protein product [Phytomonas sp. Hart1]|eukprot:CCW66567.1 unnamed protein product [Phytomonas sp. isolate Hart1]